MEPLMKAEWSKKFKLNPNAFLVKGARRSMICDLERSVYALIPNALFVILSDQSCNTLRAVVEKYDNKEGDNKNTILEYFVFLINKDLIFFTEYPGYYEPLKLEWDFPAVITNAIVDLDDTSDYDYIKVFEQLAGLGCRNIQLRVFKAIKSGNIEEILHSVENTLIESIQLIIPYINENEVDQLKALIKKYNRIRFIQIYNAPEDKLLYANANESSNLITVTNTLENKTCCGVILPHYFSVGLSTFAESQHHNTCLNRKIAIDVNGNIKNCPSMSQSFGNIGDVKLQEALAHPDFKKYWNVTKDQILVCKECEFRHVCTDCRAYIENPEDMYSKPLKCGYNPYTCTWEKWSTHPLKQEALDYYDMRGDLPAHKTQTNHQHATVPTT